MTTNTKNNEKKRTLNFAERLAFIDFVINNTALYGLEYKQLFIDYVIANYFYGYKHDNSNEISHAEIYENCSKIKAENPDFYNNELSELITVIDKKLYYIYQQQIHSNPANNAIAKLADKLGDLVDVLENKIKDADITNLQQIALSKLTELTDNINNDIK